MISRERLREVLDFNPKTGIFTWRPSHDLKSTWKRYAGRRAGSIHHAGYRYIRIDGKRLAAHQLAWLYVFGCKPTTDIDHINRNRDDNRIANLRLATRQENLANARLSKRNSSGIKGVGWNKAQRKWQAYIGKNWQMIHLGFFQNLDDAIAARRAAERQYHGEFARAA